MHEHEHEHSHLLAADEGELPEYGKRALAIQSLLVDKGILTADEIRRAVEEMDVRTPAQGAQVVARAWVDPAFKARLLTDAKSAVGELGIDTGSLSVLVAIANTEKVHNVVVCTLCSCYPRAVLGLPPDW